MEQSRKTVKDVLRACVVWKRAVDAGTGGAVNVSPISKELYTVITCWQESMTLDSIEEEVFDNPRLGDK